MQCPNCNETLVRTQRHGVEIEYCPSCRGVWLDRGELRKILEQSANYTIRQDPSQGPILVDYHQHPEAAEPVHGGERRRGFLDDIFDFD